jgi:hypothetical protein
MNANSAAAKLGAGLEQGCADDIAGALRAREYTGRTAS